MVGASITCEGSETRERGASYVIETSAKSPYSHVSFTSPPTHQFYEVLGSVHTAVWGQRVEDVRSVLFTAGKGAKPPVTILHFVTCTPTGRQAFPCSGTFTADVGLAGLVRTCSHGAYM